MDVLKADSEMKGPAHSTSDHLLNIREAYPVERFKSDDHGCGSACGRYPLLDHCVISSYRTTIDEATYL